MITDFLIAPFESIINRYLQLDPATADKFAKLSDKTLKLEITDFDIQFYIKPTLEKITFTKQLDGPVDAILRGRSMALFKSWARQKEGHLKFDEEIEISGDTDFVHSLNKLFQEIDIDWEEQMSKVTGDVIAHEVAQPLRKAKHWASKVQKSLGKNLSDYIQEEKRLLPTQRELNDFYAEVDTLRDDLERFELKITRLEANLI